MTVVKTSLVKKLSSKVLVGNVKAYIKDLQEGQSVDLFRVVGIASDLKHGTSNYGDWTALMGNFVAEPLIGAKLGQRFRTGQLFLPDVVQFMIEPLINDNRTSRVELAFVVSAMVDESSSTGYVYSGDFLMEPEENDPLENLLNKAMPALPAPMGETEKPNAKK